MRCSERTKGGNKIGHELEERLLEKLEKGVYDGTVGTDSILGVWKGVSLRKCIENGVPKIIRVQTDRSGYEYKEVLGVYETRFEKLLFLWKYGWLIDDMDAIAFSRLEK